MQKKLYRGRLSRSLVVGRRGVYNTCYINILVAKDVLKQKMDIDSLFFTFAWENSVYVCEREK